jgi:hypothetical protein
LANLVAGIEEEADAMRKNRRRASGSGGGPDPASPHPTRAREARAARPLFRREVRRQLYEAYSWLLSEFRTAAEKVKVGDPAINTKCRIT